MVLEQGDNPHKEVDTATTATAAAATPGENFPQEPVQEPGEVNEPAKTMEELQSELEMAKKQVDDKDAWARSMQSERDRLLNHLNQQQLPPENSSQPEMQPDMTADQWVKAMSSEDPAEREKAFVGLQQSAKELALQEFQQREQTQRWEQDRQQTLGNLTPEEQYAAELAINEDMQQGYFTHPADAYLRAKAGNRERLAQLVELGLKAEHATNPPAVQPLQQPAMRPVIPQVPGMSSGQPASRSGGSSGNKPQLGSLWNIRA